MIIKSIREINEMVDGTLLLNGGSEDALVKGVSIDSRQIEDGNLYIPIVGARVDGHTFIEQVEAKGASLVFCSNKEYAPVNMPVILVEDTVAALQQLAKRYRESLSCKVIGITGSNGKTSCKDILAGMLSSKYKTQKTAGNRNNEIGVPLTLLDLWEDTQMAVVEMGMENKEEIHFLNDMVQQDIAIITSIGIAHLENLGSMENIAKAKLEIVDSLQDGALFIYPREDEVLKEVIKEKTIPSGVMVQTFGEGLDCTMYLTSLKQSEKGITFTTNKSDFPFHIQILGKHQAYNAMAALLIGYAIGMSEEEMQKGLDVVENTSMRNELLHVGKCTILNDAYKSNPQSAKATLDTFVQFTHPYKVCVLADMLDLGETTEQLHYDLGASLEAYDIKEVLCMGELASHIAKGAKEHCGKEVKVLHFTNREEVFAYLKEYVNKDCMIAFKGSRGMALDLVIDMMKEYGEGNGKN